MKVIEVKNLSKHFKIYKDKRITLKEKILFFNSSKQYEVRSVLKNINLTINKGEVVGLVGSNGSGKSTLLKIMSRILYPNSGDIVVNGTVSSLLELGAGFHPDLTGKENIFTNASIFGLSRREIEKKLDEIIAFSELEEYINAPVRTYSSGMYMRLAFSVAINVDAEILLIDEILAVGDARFQSKCFGKLNELKSRGTTIVIVSHDMGTLNHMCNRLVWIKDGLVEIDAEPKMVTDLYMGYMNRSNVAQ